MKEKVSEPTQPQIASERKSGTTTGKKSSRQQPQQPSLDVDG
jgi:hypothetical protein